jgi:hypothetical protein
MPAGNTQSNVYIELIEMRFNLPLALGKLLDARYNRLVKVPHITSVSWRRGWISTREKSLLYKGNGEASIGYVVGQCGESHKNNR